MWFDRPIPPILAEPVEKKPAFSNFWFIQEQNPETKEWARKKYAADLMGEYSAECSWKRFLKKLAKTGDTKAYRMTKCTDYDDLYIPRKYETVYSRDVVIPATMAMFFPDEWEKEQAKHA